MIFFSDIKREFGFLVRQRHLVFALIILVLLSGFSVWSGLSEVQNQRDTITRLLEKDALDREDVLSHQSDFGSAAYYTFHLTYDEPSSLAFAAMGQRDVFPWKHRIRMLALEGQIYETDADNPELSLLGRFDFAFLVSVLLPLFIILMLHDLRSGERESGRFDLLVVTARSTSSLWLARTLTTGAMVFLATVMPFCIGAAISGTTVGEALAVALLVLLNIVFWSALVVGLSSTRRFASTSSARIASSLLGIWLLFTFIVPVSSNALIQRMVESPSGGDIVLTQREAVNSAWDLPFSDTWNAFLPRHPQWKAKTDMDSLFEWKWYYAFQQVGDQKAEPLSQAYRNATQVKDRYAGYAALMSPPLLTQRLFSRFAQTDTRALLDYEDRVRTFHGELRTFYYPLLFNEVAFTKEALNGRPAYTDSSIKKSHTLELKK